MTIGDDEIVMPRAAYTSLVESAKTIATAPLLAEIERLRTALEKIAASHNCGMDNCARDKASSIAREALRG